MYVCVGVSVCVCGGGVALRLFLCNEISLSYSILKYGVWDLLDGENNAQLFPTPVINPKRNASRSHLKFEPCNTGSSISLPVLMEKWNIFRHNEIVTLDL